MKKFSAIYTHTAFLHKPRNVNDAHRDEQIKAGFNTKLAVGITKGFGSIWAFYALVVWMLLWVGLATAGVWFFRHDPYPFTFLLFLSNLVQLWALPVLAVGQNVLGRHSELLAEEQYNYVMKSYHDLGQLAEHLTAQDGELLEQTKKLNELLQHVGES